MVLGLKGSFNFDMKTYLCIPAQISRDLLATATFFNRERSTQDKFTLPRDVAHRTAKENLLKGKSDAFH